MFFSQYFSFPCQYHSTNAPYSFIHLPPTMYNVFLPVLHCQYHPTSAPYSLIHLLPTQYNFSFSQYFSFPLTVSFHQCSIRFPLPTPTQNMFFSQYFNFPCQYHSNSAPYSPLYYNCSYQKDKRAKPGNLAKSSAVSEIGEHSITSYFHPLVSINRLTRSAAKIEAAAVKMDSVTLTLFCPKRGATVRKTVI